MSDIRVGVSPFASTRAGSFAVADAAQAAGFDTFWLGEGLLEVEAFPRWAGGMEPLVWLAHLAGRHPGMRVGLGASVLPLRDVAWLAKQAATLDNLTEGNFVLALAPGFWEREFTYRGLDFANRGRLFDELLDGLQAAFAGREHHSSTLDLPADGRLSPPPHAPGGPALWLAGGPATLRRALRHGLPFQASRTLPDDLAPVARRWFDEGGSTLGIRVRVDVLTGGDAAEASPVLGDAVVGPPAAVAAQLAAYADLGVTDISIIPGQDDASSLRTVTALGEHVLPDLGWGRPA
jgi:alkanesulfonate monooxygenase SsuD/methylene tetrahydromethanopterin reductase-like flavin-dependent oxidoreductase (luciferase family)